MECRRQEQAIVLHSETFWKQVFQQAFPVQGPLFLSTLNFWLLCESANELFKKSFKF